MPIQDINLGTGPNTGTGDDARTAGSKINSNFAYILNLIKLKMGNYYVQKAVGNTNPGGLEIGDKFEGWIESDTRYVVGVVIALPFDVDDTAKVKLAVNNYI